MLCWWVNTQLSGWTNEGNSHLNPSQYGRKGRAHSHLRNSYAVSFIETQSTVGWPAMVNWKLLDFLKVGIQLRCLDMLDKEFSGWEEHGSTVSGPIAYTSCSKQRSLLCVHMYVFACISVDAHMSWHVCGGQRMSLAVGPCFPPEDSQLLFATAHTRLAHLWGRDFLSLPSISS